MGSMKGHASEQPEHTVSVSDFYISQYPVTQGQWSKLMAHNPSCFKDSAANPVEQISRPDIQQFLNHLNASTDSLYRLPTEAEWEYAATLGGERYLYAGSNTIHDIAWFSENSDKKTHPVGLKPPNALDLHDMTGNVWEWVQDWYDDTYYEESPFNNPSGPMISEQRVARGGSWDSTADCCRNTYREIWYPHYKNNRLGFRLAKSAD